MKLPKIKLKLTKSQRKRIRKWLKFSPVAATMLGCAVLLFLAWPAPAANVAGAANLPPNLRKSFSATVQAVHALQKRQQDEHSRVVSNEDLNRQISNIQLDAASGDFTGAKADISALKKALDNWNFELNGLAGQQAAKAAAPATHVASGTYLPILLYHYPPLNFEEQLAHLERAGYTTIDLDQAQAGLHGGPLPAKPVVITFDDGFAAQMTAYDALLRHHMKATFYIIDGGEASQWCIGAGRRYGDPLQPPNGCGDGYLTWDQVRMIDHSGLITIGGHTVNHRNLAKLSAEEQRFEILGGKQQLEAQLGHAVRHFAYPYGAFNSTSIQIVQEAGYVTATTTEAGSIQPDGSDFTLRRVRDALTLN